MRIGVNGRFYGARTTGVQRFARELTAHLAVLEDVVLLLPSNVPEDAGTPPDTPVLRGRLPGKLWEQIELPAAAATVDIVLHPASAAPWFGPPGVVVLHDLTPLSHPGWYRPTYRGWVRVAHAAPARRAHHVLTVSDWSAQEIHRLLGIPPERISVVLQAPGPLDAPASPEEVTRVRRLYGLGRPYFLAVAGGDPKKGGNFLAGIWTGRNGPQADLVTVGGRFEGVHAADPSAGVVHRHLGHVPDEDLRALYSGAAALLFPSEAEGFGRPPLEALACGTRVVVAPYGPAAQVLGTAADVLPLEVDAWAERLATLLAEPPHVRSARIQEGRRHAKRFSWDRAAEAVARACRAVAGTTT